MTLDLRPEGIAAARDLVAPVFRDTPQFLNERLAGALGREVLVKVETLNPIGSFKARGASVLARGLDPSRAWICSTAGNFGQALAYVARERGAAVEAFVSPQVPQVKVDQMRVLGARVSVHDEPETAAREFAAGSPDRLLVVDGREPSMAEGAGTIGLELAAEGPIDAAVVQVGDGALVSGVACWLKSVAPRTRIVGVCAAGAPAMARSFAAGHAVPVEGDGTIATALAIAHPVPESVARVCALVDDFVLVDDDDLRRGMALVTDCLGLLVEPAGAAGVAALIRYGDEIAGARTAVILTGAGSAT
ncbi:MAG TPA: pyridoxal-phosphate dependent enzyme [Gaiellaceae bacterium]